MNLDFVSIIENISKSLQPIEHLIAGAAYLMGITAFIMGLVKLYHNNNIGGGEEGIAVSLYYFLGGAMLIFLPTSLDALSKTVFGLNNVLEYVSPNAVSLFGSITLLIQTAGLAFFVRGCSWLIASNQSGVNSGYRGVVFIIAGILAINFTATVSVFGSMMNSLAAMALKIKYLFSF